MLTGALSLFAGTADPPPRLAFGVGYYDIVDRVEEAVDFRFEYRWGWSYWILKPWAGIEVTTDEALYGVIGILADFDLGPRWIVTPSGGIGAYDDGDGKDLGNTVEFRTQIEFAYRLENDTRIIFAWSHLSNADLGDENPGTEVLSVYYSIPLD